MVLSKINFPHTRTKISGGFGWKCVKQPAMGVLNYLSKSSKSDAVSAKSYENTSHDLSVRFISRNYERAELPNDETHTGVESIGHSRSNYCVQISLRRSW